MKIAFSVPNGRNLMWLYEGNYDRLMLLFPELTKAGPGALFAVDGSPGFRLEVAEHGRYTSLATLYQRLGEDGRYVWDPRMKVRLYHDARLAEATGYQNHGRFKPRYRYPNREMLYPHEKRQVNLFLAEWLNHCLERGYGYPVRLETSPV